MYPHMLGLMISKAEYDPNLANYLPKVSALGIPMTARIDHATNYGYDAIFPSKDNNVDKLNLFKYKPTFNKNNPDFKRRYRTHKINIDGQDTEVYVLNRGKQSDYILFMRGVCDFAEMPDSIINQVFDNFIQGSEEKDIERKRQARLQLRDTAKDYFKNKIIHFKHQCAITEEDKNAKVLQDIDWKTFIEYPKQKSQSQVNLLSQLSHCSSVGCQTSSSIQSLKNQEFCQ